MPLVVGVTFRRVGKIYYFDPGELQLNEGDFVIAETARGVEFGEVALEPREVPEEELVAPLKKVIRVASGDDLQKEAANREKEKQALEICERKVVEHGLPMKLLDAEYAFDGSQITFSFSADGRVDFRELVKDVASALRAKVQLHQIGVRDEAKLIGGYGGCGRSLCCSTFLSSFEPVSMKMAKDQSLFLNPAKFSGVCGKLMCCLRYEHDYYKQAQKKFPSVGAIIPLENGGKGRVVDVNMINGVLTVENEESVIIHISMHELHLEGLCRKHGCACNMSEKNCQKLLATDEDEFIAQEQEDDEDELSAILDDVPEIEEPEVMRPEPRHEIEKKPEQAPEREDYRQNPRDDRADNGNGRRENGSDGGGGRRRRRDDRSSGRINGITWRSPKSEEQSADAGSADAVETDESPEDSDVSKIESRGAKDNASRSNRRRRRPNRKRSGGNKPHSGGSKGDG